MCVLLSEGLEALSRYVVEPVHVDIDPKVVQSLHHNKYTYAHVSIRIRVCQEIYEFQHVDGNVRKHKWSL